MAPNKKPPGSLGINNHYPWGPDPRDLYRGFIANAEFYGMPVAFLRVVGKRYTFHVTAAAGPFSTEHANPITNSMYLNVSTYKMLIKMETALPVGEATAIATAYHESTHAFLDLKENEPKFKKLIEDGIKHYQGAPMAGGGLSRTPERLFQE